MTVPKKAAGVQVVKYRKRLFQTGEKVRRVIGLFYIEDLTRAGKTYWDLCAYIDHLHIKAVISPIHDRDLFTGQDVWDWCVRHIDPETGDLDHNYLDVAPFVGKPKKPHCHVGILVTAQKTAEEFSALFEDLMPVRASIWDKMLDYESFVRYLAHLDSPEKAQYSPFDVRAFGGADLSYLLKDDKMDKINSLVEMVALTEQNKYRYYHQLVRAVCRANDIDKINLVFGRASVFIGYFNSLRFEREDNAKAREAMDKQKNNCTG